jgi:hypothetical protein
MADLSKLVRFIADREAPILMHRMAHGRTPEEEEVRRVSKCGLAAWRLAVKERVRAERIAEALIA